MSLSAAVLEIAEQMEADSKDEGLLRAYARQLRSAVKASGGIPPERNTIMDAVMREARADAQRGQVAALSGESGERYVELMGGGEVTTLVPVPSAMPVGAKTSIGGAIYELRQDGKLYVVPKSKAAIQ